MTLDNLSLAFLILFWMQISCIIFVLLAVAHSEEKDGWVLILVASIMIPFGLGMLMKSVYTYCRPKPIRRNTITNKR